jgi:hypothetical protein
MSARETAKEALRGIEDSLPEPLPSYRVKRHIPTGTAELRTAGMALDSIHNTLQSFVDTIARTDEKEGQIAQRLIELKEAVESCISDEDLDNIEEILTNLDDRIFEEQVFTEKCGKGAMRMTTATKLAHLEKLSSAAAKIASNKQKMSYDDYVPKGEVVDKAQETLDETRKLLFSSLPRQIAEEKMNDFMQKLVKIWDK